MTATANLPASPLINDLIGNYQGSTRRITLTALAALLGDGNGTGAPAAIAQLQADMLAADALLRSHGGKIFGTRQMAVDFGQANLSAAFSRILTIEDEMVVIRGPNITGTGTDPLFGSNPSWGVIDRIPVMRALRRVGVIGLETLSAAGNFHTAQIDSTLQSFGNAALVNGMLMSFQPVLANTGPASLTISGVQAASPILNSDGAALTGGELQPYRTYILQWRGPAASYRIVAGDVTPAVLAALRAAITAEVNASVAALSATTTALRAEIDGNYVTADQDGVSWWGWDRTGKAVSGWSSTGLRVVLDDWTLANAGPRMLSDPALEISVTTGEAIDGRVLDWDAAGNAIWMWRDGPDGGFDGHMCAEFWARGAVAMAGQGAQLSTTQMQVCGYNGQSLTVGGTYVAGLTRAALMQFAGPGCLQIDGLRRGDGVVITDTLGPRGAGYDTAVPGTGFASAQPGATASGMAYPTFAVLNLHRADLGLPQVPVVTSGHGISGIPIELMDDDPETGTSSETIVWNNFTFWHARAQALALAAGKSIRPGWEVMTHGTSAKDMARGAYAAAWWALQADSFAYLDQIGLPRPRYMITQPGGDANTVGDSWAVCDDVLDICEQGGAVLGTPNYWYEIADNNVHPDGLATALICDTDAWAMAEVEAGRAWTIRRPVVLSRAGGRIVLDFASLREDEALAIQDPAKYGGVGIDGFLGFQLIGGAITGVTLRGRTVIIDHTGAPSGIRYAMQSQDVSGNAGNRYNAHRGLLRTTLQKPSKLVPGRMLQRAVPSFTLEF